MTPVQITFNPNLIYQKNPYAYQEREEELLANATRLIHFIVDMKVGRLDYKITGASSKGATVWFSNPDTALLFKLSWVS
jgi:hypothetical protein